MPSSPSSLGFGLGLRPDHYEAVLCDAPRIDWFEAVSGETFGSICAALDQNSANSAERAAAMLSIWWRDGLVIDARVN